MNLRPEVAAFAQLMEQQLRANDHKPGWKGDSPGALWRRLMHEAQELAQETHDQDPREIDCVKAANEAADVANFAMMIADVCGALRYDKAGPSSKGGPYCPQCDGRMEGDRFVHERCCPMPLAQPADDTPVVTGADAEREAIARIIDPTAWAEVDDFCRTFTMMDRDAALTKADAILARQAPSQATGEGWKLVPVEPTEAMLEAAASNPAYRLLAENMYRAMLSTAPEAPQAPSGEMLEAVIEQAVVDVLERRAAYFDRTSKGAFDRMDAARSYRATVKEVRSAIRKALAATPTPSSPQEEGE